MWIFCHRSISKAATKKKSQIAGAQHNNQLTLKEANTEV